MTGLDKWAKSCEKSGLEIWRLESSGETELYMTKVPCVTEQHKIQLTTPVYHVWRNDEWLLATLNYREALEMWRDVTAISGR